MELLPLDISERVFHEERRRGHLTKLIHLFSLLLLLIGHLNRTMSVRFWMNPSVAPAIVFRKVLRSLRIRSSRWVTGRLILVHIITLENKLIILISNINPHLII